MDRDKPTIVFSFDKQNYEPKEVYDLKEKLSPGANVQVEELFRKSLEVPLLFSVLILVPLYYFNKGFFTKLGEKMGEKIGEKLGDAVGEDAVKAYELLKKEAVKVIQNSKSGKMPTVEFSFSINGAIISGFVKSSDEKIISIAFDSVEELFTIAKEYISEQKLDLKKFVFNFDIEDMLWNPSYYITAENEIFKF